MNDRELLELAAKAYGITLRFNSLGLLDARCDWNPLTDDGDALRLAVALNLHAARTSENRIACYKEKSAFDSDLPGNDAWEVISDCWFPSAPVKSAEVAINQLSATRRAIVLAAAEIGKAMP